MRGPTRHQTDLRLYRRLLLEAKPFWNHLGLLFLLSLVSAPLMLLTPLPLKLVIDTILGSRAAPSALMALVPSGTPMLAVVAGLVVALGRNLFKARLTATVRSSR